MPNLHHFLSGVPGRARWEIATGLACARGRFFPGALFVLLAALAWGAARSGCTAPGADAAAAGSR